MSVLTTKEIMDIIPHRHPFLLVDTIEELVPGVRAAGKKCVTYDEYYFRGCLSDVTRIWLIQKRCWGRW